MPLMGSSTFTGITVPEGIKSIGATTLQYCSSLVVVNLPSTITSFGSMAFYRDYAIESTTILAIEPPSLPSGSFPLPPQGTIYVPAESVDAYKSAWTSYASRIQAIPG